MAFVREAFPSDVGRNGSVCKQLVKKWGLAETEVLIRGVATMVAVAALNYVLGKLPGGVPVAVRSGQ